VETINPSIVENLLSLQAGKGWWRVYSVVVRSNTWKGDIGQDWWDEF